MLAHNVDISLRATRPGNGPRHREPSDCRSHCTGSAVLQTNYGHQHNAEEEFPQFVRLRTNQSTMVGTPCYGVPARVQRAEQMTATALFTPEIAPLNAARTAQRARPYQPSIHARPLILL